jgi:hypothetical protein
MVFGGKTGVLNGVKWHHQKTLEQEHKNIVTHLPGVTARTKGNKNIPRNLMARINKILGILRTGRNSRNRRPPQRELLQV